MEGFSGETTQICLEKEDMGGGGEGDRESRQSKVIRRDHFSEVTFKGGTG